MSFDKEYVRGLRDVAACETKISFVDPYGALYYSGYDIDRLIGRVCYEEVVFLLINGKLPNIIELKTIKKVLYSEMKIPKNLVNKCVNKNGHPIENLRTALSIISESDSDFEKFKESGNKKVALKLIAKVPSLVAAIYRLRNDKEILAPKQGRGFAENFLYMFRGKPANKEEIKALDRYLILHADHGLNASTFTARVTASTRSDVYSAVISAIGSLRGTLHGGAGERVMNMLLDVDNPAEVEAYIQAMLSDGKRIMGFGHRIYRNEDPRSRHLRKISKSLCSQIDRTNLYNKARAIQYVVHKERQIFPNVDFYAALVLNALGFPKKFITPLFASSRITGWVAHILEQYDEAVLIRPTSTYLGAHGTKYFSLEKRK